MSVEPGNCAGSSVECDKIPIEYEDCPETHENDTKKETKKIRRSVRFPDEDQLVTQYFEPANPWQDVPPTTPDQLAEEYAASCRRHNTVCIDTVVQQIREFPQSSIGGSTRAPLLTLSECVLLGPAPADALEAVLKKVQFRRIELDHALIDDEGAEALFDMAEYYESATVVSINGPRQYGIRGWQATSRLIKKSAELSELEVTDSPIEASHSPVLARSLLPYSCRLRALCLQRVELSGEPLLCLVIALKSNSSVRELRLGDNHLTVSDAVQISSLLRYNNKIQLLDLSNNQIQDAGVSHLADALGEQASHSPSSAAASPISPHKCLIGGHESRGMTFLVLWNNQLTRNCAPYIGKALRSCSSLRVLNIGRNAVGNEAVRAACAGWLVSLGLQAARLTADAAAPLADLIKHCTLLQRLDLRENRLGSAGLQAILDAMKENSTLTQIDLDEPPESPNLLAEDSEAAQVRQITREIRALCRKNEPPALHVDNQAVHRKISLTCHTTCFIKGMGGEEERRGGRLRSPAPSPGLSPAPSPAGSPVPTPHANSRFSVTRVTPDRDPSSEGRPSTHARPTYSHAPSRFKVVQVMEPPKIQVHPAVSTRKATSRFSVTRNYDSIYNPSPSARVNPVHSTSMNINTIKSTTTTKPETSPMTDDSKSSCKTLENIQTITENKPISKDDNSKGQNLPNKEDDMNKTASSCEIKTDDNKIMLSEKTDKQIDNLMTTNKLADTLDSDIFVCKVETNIDKSNVDDTVVASKHKNNIDSSVGPGDASKIEEVIVPLTLDSNNHKASSSHEIESSSGETLLLPRKTVDKTTLQYVSDKTDIEIVNTTVEEVIPNVATSELKSDEKGTNDTFIELTTTIKSISEESAKPMEISGLCMSDDLKESAIGEYDTKPMTSTSDLEIETVCMGSVDMELSSDLTELKSRVTKPSFDPQLKPEATVLITHENIPKTRCIAQIQENILTQSAVKSLDISQTETDPGMVKTDPEIRIESQSSLKDSKPMVIGAIPIKPHSSVDSPVPEIKIESVIPEYSLSKMNTESKNTGIAIDPNVGVILKDASHSNVLEKTDLKAQHKTESECGQLENKLVEEKKFVSDSSKVKDRVKVVTRDLKYSEVVKKSKLDENNTMKQIVAMTEDLGNIIKEMKILVKDNSDLPKKDLILKKNKSESSLDSPDLEVSRLTEKMSSVFDSNSSLEISGSSMESLNEHNKTVQELDRRKSGVILSGSSLESDVTPVNSNLLNLSVSSNDSVSPIFGKTKQIHDSLSSLEVSVSSLDSTKQEKLMVTSADSGIEYSIQNRPESKEDNSSNEGTLTNYSSLKETIKKPEIFLENLTESPKRASSLLDVPIMKNKSLDRMRKISWVSPSSSFPIPKPEEKEKPSHLEKLLSLFQHPSSIFSRHPASDDEKKATSSSTPPRKDSSLTSSFWAWGSATEKDKEEDNSEATDSTLSERVQVSYVDESFSRKLDSKTPSTDTDNTLSEFQSFPHESESEKVTVTTEDKIVQKLDLSVNSKSIDIAKDGATDLVREKENVSLEEKEDLAVTKPRSFAAVLKSSGSENSIGKQSSPDGGQAVDKLPSKVIRGIKENISPENTLTSSMTNTKTLVEELDKIKTCLRTLPEVSSIREANVEDTKFPMQLAPIATIEETDDLPQLAYIDDIKVDDISTEGPERKDKHIDLGKDALSYLMFENKHVDIVSEQLIKTTPALDSLAQELKDAEHKEIIDLSPELVLDEGLPQSAFTSKEIIGLRTSPIIPERAKLKKSNSLEDLSLVETEKSSPKAKTIAFKIPESTSPRAIPERRTKLRTRSGSSPKSLPDSLNKPCPLSKIDSVLTKKKKRVSSLGKMAKDSLLALNMSEDEIAEFRRSYKLTSVESLKSLESVSEDANSQSGNSIDSRCRACLRTSQESLMSLDSITEDCKCSEDCAKPGRSAR